MLNVKETAIKTGVSDRTVRRALDAIESHYGSELFPVVTGKSRQVDEKYIPMIEEYLKNRQLPEDLEVYLSQQNPFASLPEVEQEVPEVEPKSGVIVKRIDLELPEVLAVTPVEVVNLSADAHKEMLNRVNTFSANSLLQNLQASYQNTEALLNADLAMTANLLSKHQQVKGDMFRQVFQTTAEVVKEV